LGWVVETVSMDGEVGWVVAWDAVAMVMVVEGCATGVYGGTCHGWKSTVTSAARAAT
jgi:hypothetical protein